MDFTAYIKNTWKKSSYENSRGTAASTWDSVAKDYVYYPDLSFDEDGFLTYLKSRTALNKNMKILDIGCGAGAYTLALSEYAHSVTGVDFSPKMIECAKKSAEKYSIKNAEFYVKDWHKCPVGEFSKKYDLVFAHTTPAVWDYETLIKMMEASCNYCVICQPARRTDLVYDEIRKIAGCENNKFDDFIAYAFSAIWGNGCNPQVEYKDVVWKMKKTVSHIEPWYLGRLKEDRDIDKETENKIKSYLEEISTDGYVNEIISSTLVNMCWQV